MTGKKNVFNLLMALWYMSVLMSCDPTTHKESKPQLFTYLPSSSTSVNFVNPIIESEDYHYYQYIYAYMGGGVASADFNNDGLEDLFFVSNTQADQLYLNQGNLKFKNISQTTGITHADGFDAGVTIVDVNQDGFLDIYICRAGWLPDEDLYTNLLYINNGDLTFSERANEYGLDDANRSVMATFFDYDKDGDLDMYLVNSPEVTSDYRNIYPIEDLKTDQATIALKGSDKLYRNEGNHQYVDVSASSGILPDRGFGLHAQVGDLNQDGWLDIYVSNDLEYPDFVFLNNQDGTFSEAAEKVVKHMSYYSMGSDMADLDNDTQMDLMVLDMNPEDYIRAKTTMSMTSPAKFHQMVDQGYHYQYMHNMLQRNNGDGTFSEIAQLAGMANTDWSWATLLADFDLDGFNDIYVTNGVFRDVIDQDANIQIGMTARKRGRKPSDAEFLEYTQMLPQQKMNNYLFRNRGDLTFENMTQTWADTLSTFSNGAIYADLDNDGDLEIVVNNINDKATILKNEAIELGLGQYLKLQFKGPAHNRNGIGVRAKVTFENQTSQVRQLINSRGFLSSVSNTLHFGFSKSNQIHQVEITWPDGKTQTIRSVVPNQLLTVDYTVAINEPKSETATKPLFAKQTLGETHDEILYDDYVDQVLLPYKLSQMGPAVATSDINGDGIEDLYLGGSRSFSGKILMGTEDGFHPIVTPDFESDQRHEDVAAVFFDADQDGDQDLYVVSGSYEYPIGHPALQDRLYANDGNGNFLRQQEALPAMVESGSVVVPADYDQDGDIDLFVGGRLIPSKYPHAPRSFLLINEKGTFKDKTVELAPELAYLGMVTSAQWADIDQNGTDDLILAGEWMGIEVLVNTQGKLRRSTSYENLAQQVGWWNQLVVDDIDQDGDLDIVTGNLGLNSKHHAAIDKPYHVYANDFDQSGTEDVFLVKYYKDRQVPVRGKNCSTQQLPQLARSITSYSDFAHRDFDEIVGAGIQTAIHYQAVEFRSGIFRNQGNGFDFEPFTNHCQAFPINSILVADLNEDGHKDLILAGNNYMMEIETTRMDAGNGEVLMGSPNGRLQRLPYSQTGWKLDQDVRSLHLIRTADGGRSVLTANNNSSYQLHRIL
ncbi:VCBS repeat-containing protein [Reichenbachiella carrageenanivorans]|uniref:VCBS repeat-containing protein n=1 Tax=Reichenbachiella carrageenanivorans TaxID=2979869 RepID=A0ABY6CYU0_9BACT|nr:VCBS repeat-containing protein [Reichenbachiella carrageenanivorans]UXX79072.1 VCBS repeat-containing protein [Reichenbachiella carrageenanivorans]